jgi:hypothetical protein
MSTTILPPAATRQPAVADVLRGAADRLAARPYHRVGVIELHNSLTSTAALLEADKSTAWHLAATALETLHSLFDEVWMREWQPRCESTAAADQVRTAADWLDLAATEQAQDGAA